MSIFSFAQFESRCVVAVLVLGLCWAAPARLVAQETAAPAVPVDRQPYSVRIVVAFEAEPASGAAWRTRVVHDLQDGIERAVGEMWRSTIVEDTSGALSGSDALARLKPGDLARICPSGSFDKVYLLTLRLAGAGLRASGREWDAITGELSAVASEETSEPRDVVPRLLAVLASVFRPVAEVETSKAGAKTLRVRGADFTPRDEAFRPLKSGARFEPYYRYRNKQLEVERIQLVPWTYLLATECVRGVASADVVSGLRSALPGRRRRIDVVALGISARHATTKLVLMTRAPGSHPLAGVEVEIATAPVAAAASADSAADSAAATAPTEPAPRLVADRSGCVVIRSEQLAKWPTLWLRVYSGQALLARLPFVPGVRAVEVLELPDDGLRLQVEGEISMLQSELLDTVARRAVLMSLARTRAKTREWNEVDALIAQIAKVQNPAEFEGRLNAIRVPSLARARKNRDRGTELRIAKLCDETAELINHYLDPDKLRELKEEMSELKISSADEKALEKAGK
jgi:hypothetical protein